MSTNLRPKCRRHSFIFKPRHCTDQGRLVPSSTTERRNNTIRFCQNGLPEPATYTPAKQSRKWRNREEDSEPPSVSSSPWTWQKPIVTLHPERTQSIAQIHLGSSSSPLPPPKRDIECHAMRSNHRIEIVRRKLCFRWIYCSSSVNRLLLIRDPFLGHYACPHVSEI